MWHMTNYNYQPSMHPQYYDQAPQRSSRAERVRTVARRAVGTVAIVAAAGGAIFGLTKASEGHSGPAYDKKTEAGIERVIQPEMQSIAQTALKLEAKPGSSVSALHPHKGITELTGFSSDGSGSIDVVMRDFPGTNRPNPKDVLVVDLQSNINAGNNDPKGGAFVDNEVTYIAPGGNQYAGSSIVAGIYAVDKEGWTAIDSTDKGTNGVADDLLSGTIDTADSNYYAVNPDTENTVGPVATAQDTISDAENLLPIVVDSLQ